MKKQESIFKSNKQFSNIFRGTRIDHKVRLTLRRIHLKKSFIYKYKTSTLTPSVWPYIIYLPVQNVQKMAYVESVLCTIWGQPKQHTFDACGYGRLMQCGKLEKFYPAT